MLLNRAPYSTPHLSRKKVEQEMLAQCAQCDWSCERWCAQPLGCTCHATKGSLCVTMLSDHGWAKKVSYAGYEPNAERWLWIQGWMLQSMWQAVGGTWCMTGRWAVLGESMAATAACRVWQAMAACRVWQLRRKGTVPNSRCGGSCPVTLKTFGDFGSCAIIS